jgi:hypothetical protein
MSFFGELRRRNVFRVGIAYCAAIAGQAAVKNLSTIEWQAVHSFVPPTNGRSKSWNT